MTRIYFFLVLVSLITASCTSQYAVEDALYNCIDQEFTNKALNLEDELDTLEILFLDEGLLASASPADYRNYYQGNINQGMLRALENPHLRTIVNQIGINYNQLESCALRKIDADTYNQSKFGQISNMIDTMTQSTGQITSGTVATAHLKVLTADDFEHPFYRANVLLSLQNLYYQKYLGGDKEFIRSIPKKIQ